MRPSHGLGHDTSNQCRSIKRKSGGLPYFSIQHSKGTPRVSLLGHEDASSWEELIQYECTLENEIALSGEGRDQVRRLGMFAS